jgi:hypothetical protein
MTTLLIYRIIRSLFWFYMGWQSAEFLKWGYRRIKEKRQEKLYKIEQEKLNKILLDKEAEEILQKEFQREQQQRREHHVDQER